MGKHGFAKHVNTENLRLYQIWSGMKQRCLNPKQAHFELYGGRGITVCEEWLNSFEKFLDDMGPRPDNNFSLDRIDNNQGYSRDNCRWATRVQQSQNRRTNIMITFGSATRALSYWCKMFGMPHATATSRIKKDGYEPQMALTTPLKHSKVKVGDRYNNLVVIELLEFKNWDCRNKHRAIICQCDCGSLYETLDSRVKHGKTKSCFKCSIKIRKNLLDHSQ